MKQLKERKQKVNSECDDFIKRQLAASPELEMLAKLRGFYPATYIAEDDDSKDLLQWTRSLANVSDPVLITGESGTGKDMLARELHGARKGKFVAVNMTAITDTLFESEMFGHRRGSFSGAITDRSGLVKHAEGGTLFLDEIGDMPHALQAKLLRLLENGTYRPVGSDEELTVSCRIVAATHANLEELVNERKFREDLYYRIAVLELHLKPIDARPLDKIAIAKSFGADEELIARLSVLKFKGNIRQLKSYVRKHLLYKTLRFTR